MGCRASTFSAAWFCRNMMQASYQAPFRATNSVFRKGYARIAFVARNLLTLENHQLSGFFQDFHRHAELFLSCFRRSQ
jgi:hypothetical protein